MLGWTDALTAAGIEPLVVRHSLQPEDSEYDAARVLLELDEPPTAILCFSDVMAALGACAPPRTAGSGCRRTCRWWASTTTRWPSGCARR